MSPISSQYIHGTDPEEQRRLSRLNELLNEACLRELDLRGGEKILDVGSGLGQFTRAMARAAGSSGRVLGVERSPEQIAEALRQARAAGEEALVELRQGDAFALPLGEDEWGTFDLAHTRFLLEHVPDPLAVVRAMIQAVRPGGRIVLVDDDHDIVRLWPEPVGFSALWKAYMRTYELLGNDPFVGRRMIQLLHQAGATPVRNAWVWFGSCAGEATLEGKVNNMIGILVEARKTIVAAGLLDSASFDEGIRALDAWRCSPDVAFWFAFAWAEGKRRDSQAA